jgi:hypothetical protein
LGLAFGQTLKGGIRPGTSMQMPGHGRRGRGRGADGPLPRPSLVLVTNDLPVSLCKGQLAMLLAGANRKASRRYPIIIDKFKAVKLH